MSPRTFTYYYWALWRCTLRLLPPKPVLFTRFLLVLLSPAERIKNYLKDLGPTLPAPYFCHTAGVYMAVSVSCTGYIRPYVGESDYIPRRIQQHISALPGTVLFFPICFLENDVIRRKVQDWYILRWWSHRILNRYKPVSGLPPLQPYPPAVARVLPAHLPVLLQRYVAKTLRPIVPLVARVPYHRDMPTSYLCRQARLRGVRLLITPTPPVTVMAALVRPTLRAIYSYDYWPIIFALVRAKYFSTDVSPTIPNCSCSSDSHFFHPLEVNRKLALFPSSQHVVSSLKEVSLLFRCTAWVPPPTPYYLSAGFYRLLGRRLLDRGFFCLPLDHSSTGLVVCCQAWYIHRMASRFTPQYAVHHLAWWYYTAAPILRQVQDRSLLPYLYSAFHRHLATIPKSPGSWTIRYKGSMMAFISRIKRRYTWNRYWLTSHSLPGLYILPKAKGGERIVLNFRRHPAIRFQKTILVPALKAVLKLVLSKYCLPLVSSGADFVSRLRTMQFCIPGRLSDYTIGKWDVVSMFPSLPRAQVRKALAWAFACWPAKFFAFPRKKCSDVLPASSPWRGCLTRTRRQVLSLSFLELKERYAMLGAQVILSEGDGISIGACTSSLIANIYMQYCYFRSRHTLASSYLWSYTDDSFGLVLKPLDLCSCFPGISLTFEPMVGNTVRFLDVSVTLTQCSDHIAVLTTPHCKPSVLPDAAGNRTVQFLSHILCGHALRLQRLCSHFDNNVLSSVIMPFLQQLMFSASLGRKSILQLQQFISARCRWLCPWPALHIPEGPCLLFEQGMSLPHLAHMLGIKLKC